MTIHEIYSRGRVAQLKEALARAERKERFAAEDAQRTQIIFQRARADRELIEWRLTEA